MSFCLSTRMNNLLGIHQTKYLIKPIIMIITIIKIKNKIRKNRLLHLELEFFQICSFFTKQNSLEWFEILNFLMMTRAAEELCLEINVIIIQQMNFQL